MNNELERISKEVVWPNFKVLTPHLPIGTEENDETLRIAGLWPEI
jgi:hypothetical protein